MRVLLSVLALCVSVNSYAVIEKGDNVPDICWSDVSSAQVCLNGFSGNVRVLVYSTGWCPGCNAEMQELAPRVGEFSGKPVTFFSLSAEGDRHGALPTPEFLKVWKERYDIPFIVAAAPKDPGKAFFEKPYYIPAVVVIDGNNRLAFKSTGADVDTVFAEIKKLLPPAR